MTDREAIDEVVRRTGVERFRFLCSELNTHAVPNSRDDYLRHIRELAAGPPPTEAPSAVESLRLARAANACPFRSTPSCGCGGPRCALRGGAAVSHLDCFPCVERYG